MFFTKLISFFCSVIGPDDHPSSKAASYGGLLALFRIVKIEQVSINSPARSSEGYEGDQLCCVCLSRLKVGQEMRMLPCQHEFHKVCVERWFSVCRKTCPICRFSMGKEEKCSSREDELTEEMVIWFSSFHAAGF